MVSRRNALIGAGVALALGLGFLGGRYVLPSSTGKSSVPVVDKREYEFAVDQLKAASDQLLNLDRYKTEIQRFASSNETLGAYVQQVQSLSNKLENVSQSNKDLTARLAISGRPDAEVVADTEKRLNSQFDAQIKIAAKQLAQYDAQARSASNQLESALQTNRVQAARIKEQDATIAAYNGSNQSRSVSSEDANRIYSIFSGVQMQFPFAHAQVLRTTNNAVFGKSESVSLGDIHLIEYMPQKGASVIDTKEEARSFVSAFDVYQPSFVNANKFEEMARANGVDEQFARKLEGGSDRFDAMAQLYTGYSMAQNSTNGFPGTFRFINKDGTEHVFGPVDSIRKLRTGAKK